jgi:hypothetical protein
LFLSRNARQRGVIDVSGVFLLKVLLAPLERFRSLRIPKELSLRESESIDSLGEPMPKPYSMDLRNRVIETVAAVHLDAMPRNFTGTAYMCGFVQSE